MKVTLQISKRGVNPINLLKIDHKLIRKIQNWGNYSNCVLYYGQIFGGNPNWLQFLKTGSASEEINLSNQGTAAVIFYPIEDRFLAILFGYAGSQLATKEFEKDFGLKVVLNSIDPEKIKSIDTKFLGNIVVNKRVQLSKDKKLQDFGFEINKDYLKHIVGKPILNSFASSISGSASLNINTDLNIYNLDNKVKEIYDYYLSDNYKKNYNWYDDIKNVKDEFLIINLNQELVYAFNEILAGNSNELYIANPSIIDYSDFDKYKIKGYRSKNNFESIDIYLLIEDLNSKKINSITLNNLNEYSIEMYNSNDIRIYSWSLFEWLIYEVEYLGKQYILNDGDWFEISNDFFKKINLKFDEIITSDSEFSILKENYYKNETEYLKSYKSNRKNEIIFDRNLFYDYGSNNSIEICDIYNSESSFIHVKEGNSSSKLSHLFNQGYVSAFMFLNDINFRKFISNELKEYKSLQKKVIKFRTTRGFKVVYRILKKGISFTIPFFSKITLIECYSKIKNMGYEFKIEWVPNNDAN